MLRKRDENTVLPQNAALLPGNRGDRVAQIILMIERDVRDHGEQRLDDIRGIQPSAKTHLKHRDLGARPGARPIDACVETERDRGQPLEEARRMRQLARIHQA